MDILERRILKGRRHLDLEVRHPEPKGLCAGREGSEAVQSIIKQSAYFCFVGNAHFQ
jgi:hypothetical protein